MIIRDPDTPVFRMMYVCGTIWLYIMLFSTLSGMDGMYEGTPAYFASLRWPGSGY